MLCESSRVDGLQASDLASDDSALMERVASDEVALIAAEKARSLILLGFDGLGRLVKLPLEVRCKICELTFSRVFEQRFWRCYHTQNRTPNPFQVEEGQLKWR